MHQTSGEFSGEKITLAGLWVNLGLIAFKLGVGLGTGSRALVADAAHSISDVVTDFVVLLGLKLGRLPADPRHPFGHHRVETMASLVVGLALLGAGVGLGLDAFRAVLNPVDKQGSWLAPLVALVSVVLKEGLYRYTIKVGERTGSPAVKANAWHHRSDAFSSICVLIGTAAAALNPDWDVADSLAAILVSALVVWAGVRVIASGASELMDRAPGKNILDSIEECVLSVEGVKSLHDLKVRSSGGRYLMVMHVVVDGNLTIRQGHEISDRVEEKLTKEIPRVEMVTVHLDPSLDQG